VNLQAGAQIHRTIAVKVNPKGAKLPFRVNMASGVSQSWW
jgi:hypothetical protein